MQLGRILQLKTRVKTRYLAALSPATDQWVIPVLCTAGNAFGTIPVVVLFLGGLVVAAWIIKLKTISSWPPQSSRNVNGWVKKIRRANTKDAPHGHKTAA